MVNKMNKKDLRKFIENVIKEEYFDGCEYLYLDDYYALVFAYDEDNHLCGKIAYNCDDLQCDYDFDWLMPLTASEEIIDTEIYACEEMNVDQLVNYFIYNYNLVK